jgi:hypothetical protein
MRIYGSIVALVAALTLAACGQNNSSSSATATTAPDNGSNAAAGGATVAPENAAPESGATAAPGEAPAYPGATMMAGGTAMNGASSGKVFTTSDSFDTVYKWYQANMPAGSEKSHTVAPVQTAVFATGQTGSDQGSVTITTAADKTMITIAHAKM